MAWLNPATTVDTPPKDWRKNCDTLGPNFGAHPKEWWGWRDWELAQSRNMPLNERLPTPLPTQALPAGFTLRPTTGRETAGDRALREKVEAKAVKKAAAAAKKAS